MKGLIDTTLREGEQRVGVNFTARQRLHIFENLCRCGVEEIEIGVSAPKNRGLSTFFRKCRRVAEKHCSRPRLALWSRCRIEDIAFAASLRPDVLALCVPSSDLHLRERLRINRADMLALLGRTLRQIRGNFSFVSVGMEDASRADQNFLKDLLHIANEYGADRVRLADTVGILSPARAQALVKLARHTFAGDIGVHCHNDFGMATANAVAALEAGADWADTTLLGIGERAGNARLEEVAAYVQMNTPDAPDTNGGYNLVAIKKLCLDIASMTGRQIDEHKAIVGAGLFTCESGLHAAAIHRAPAAYEPFDPDTVGAKRLLLYGSKTGRAAVGGRLETFGCHLSAQALDRLVEIIRTLSSERGHPFGEKEIRQLAAAIV